MIYYTSYSFGVYTSFTPPLKKHFALESVFFSPLNHPHFFCGSTGPASCRLHHRPAAVNIPAAEISAVIWSRRNAVAVELSSETLPFSSRIAGQIQARCHVGVQLECGARRGCSSEASDILCAVGSHTAFEGSPAFSA